MAGRIPVAEHAAFVRSLLTGLGARPTERVRLADAVGRITASPVESPIALPPFRNSQMDGFAVRAVDVTDVPVSLPVAGEVAAAAGAPSPLAPGTAVRIMTGAPLPDGADAIVPVEDTEPDGTRIRVLRPRAAGEYVREAGSDLAAGADVLPPGLKLASRHLAAAAASGLTELLVRERVRVAVVSTGSELVPPGSELGPGEIPDANGVAIAAAVRAVGAVVVHEGRVRDDVSRLRAELDAARAAGAELVLTSGGVSMGAYEVVRETLEPLGGWVGSVAMQPGGPQATGAYRGMPVIGFPGNPVSAQLSFELFVAPTLRAIAGLPPARTERLPLAAPLTSVAGKRQFLRGRRADGGSAEVVALVRSDGLKKADVLPTARIAGISGAKRTSELIPLAHIVPLDAVSIDFGFEEAAVTIRATASTTARTGIEMEALTAVAIAGLTLHDMVKAVDPAAQLGGIHLVEKRGGKRGVWRADAAAEPVDPAVPVDPAHHAGAAIVLVASTRAAAGTAEDTTGPVIVAWLRERGFDVDEPVVVADADVADAVRRGVAGSPAVLITTGGTGVSPGDRTPEATLAVLDRELPGVAEAIRAAGRDATPTAALSRALAGVAGRTVVVNLPGSLGGVADGLRVLDELLPHLLDQVAGGDHAPRPSYGDDASGEPDA